MNSTFTNDSLNALFVFLGFLIFSLVFVAVWWFIRKYQVQEAIFRIDKNLQKLVDNSQYASSKLASRLEDTDKNAELSSGY